MPKYPFSLDPNETTQKSLGTVFIKDPVTASYRIRVDNNAVGGLNKMDVFYWDKNSIYQKYKSDISIVVDSSSNVVLSEVKPTTINPGNTAEVSFKISNEGNSNIKNLLFEWSDPNNLILPIGSDNRKYIPSIDVGGSASLKFNVMADPNIAPGVYPLTIKMTAYGQNATATKVGMIVGGGTDFDVSVDSASSSGELSLSISNTGVNNAESVAVRLNGKTVTLGKLNKGEFTLATFGVQLPAGAGSGPADGGRLRGMGNETGLNIEISYTDTTGQRQTIEKNVRLSTMAFSGTSQQSRMADLTQGRTRNGGLQNLLIIPAAIVIVIIGFYFYRRMRRKRNED